MWVVRHDYLSQRFINVSYNANLWSSKEPQAPFCKKRSLMEHDFVVETKPPRTQNAPTLAICSETVGIKLYVLGIRLCKKFFKTKHKARIQLPKHRRIKPHNHPL